MPNPNVGLNPAWGALDCAPCERMTNCLIAECNSHGGYPACTQNATTQDAMVGRCIKDLDSLALNSAHFDSVEDRRVWALFAGAAIANNLLSMYYVDKKSVGDICTTTAGSLGSCCDSTLVNLDMKCPPGTAQASGTGIETMTTQPRVCQGCMLYADRCAANYYGVIFSSNTPCAACPSLASVAGRSAAGSIVASECYIPAGNSFTDTSGSYTLVSNCYYSE